MAKDETRRLSPSVIKENMDSLTALEDVQGYSPHKPEFNLAIGIAILNNMHLSQSKEVKADKAFKTAKDHAITNEWALHNFILGVKEQVRSQFGSDSDELQSIGLKKKVDYKRPTNVKSTKTTQKKEQTKNNDTLE
jgi:hypothetical protein